MSSLRNSERRHQPSGKTTRDKKSKYKSGEKNDQKALATFVSDNEIKQRTCSVYVRDIKSKTNNCMCGLSKEWHEKHGIDVHKHNGLNTSWYFKSHTKTCPADSFGIIEFQDFGQETLRSPYIRLSPETKLETLWTLMKHHWKVPIPKLLISVTGGAQGFDLVPKSQAAFKRGLINAATSTGAWILTGGTATGVMRIIGDAVRNHRITSSSTTNEIIALGIASWSCIANRDALVGDGDRGLFPATYSLEDVLEKEDSDYPLDRNHTHFILVDNESDGKFGAEIEFRSAFEQFVSDKVVAQSQPGEVLLVFEGGVSTMLTVYESIQKNIPVIVFSSLERAAGFIAFGYSLTEDENDEDKSVYPEDFDEEMMNAGTKMFAWRQSDNKETKLKECIKQLKYILANRKLVNISILCNIDIDRAILYAFIKATKTSPRAQLSLALSWNRCDIARDEIFTEENRQYWREHNTDLCNAMFLALVQDRADFVQLFLESGVLLNKFLSIDTLEELYRKVLQESSEAMAQMLNSLINLGNLRQAWSASQEHDGKSTAQDPELLYKIGQLMVRLLGDENFNLYRAESAKHSSDYTKTKTRPKYDFSYNAQRELFLWAILFNRRDFAKMLWSVGQDHLGAALTACALLKRLSSEADNYKEVELSQDLLDHANMYEDMAVGVLSECYRKNKMMAHQCLVRRLELYGRTTLFALADTHTLMKFMGHTCCHTKLNIIWKGRMALCTPTLKILLCIFIPFMISTITFTTNEGLLDDGDDDSDNFDKGEELTEQPNKAVQKKMSQNDPPDASDVSARPSTGRKNKKKVYRVQMCGGVRPNTIGILKALYWFYKAPVSVFVVNTVSFLIFLGLFTYFVLTDLYADHVSVIEYIVLGWTITMLTEEIRQVISNDKRSLYNKVNGWFGSMWNRFDLAMFTIFSISVILRFTLTETNFTYCRTCYSVTVGMFYLRFMQVFFAEKNSGPKVIMITNMMIDLVLFLGIFLFFLLSFGIMYQVNLFPNSPPSWYLLKSILYMPYWQMYGELFLEKLEGESPDTCTKNESIWRPAGGRDRCPENNALVPLLGAVYLILTHILLVNLLIAMFSYSFKMVQKRSESVWRFYRYSLVHEFYYRPKFCPPFIILSHIYRSILYVKRTCSSEEYSDKFKLNLNKKNNNRLTLFVRSAANNYLCKAQKAQKEELGTKVEDTSSRIDMEELYTGRIPEYVEFNTSPIYLENRRDTLLTPRIEEDMPMHSRTVEPDPATDTATDTETDEDTDTDIHPPFTPRIEEVIEKLSSIEEHMKIIESFIVDRNRPGTAEPLLNDT